MKPQTRTNELQQNKKRNEDSTFGAQCDGWTEQNPPNSEHRMHLKLQQKQKNERAVAGVMGQAGAEAMGRYFEKRSELRLTGKKWEWGGRGGHGTCLSVKQSFLVCSMGQVSEKRKREVKKKTQTHMQTGRST